MTNILKPVYLWGTTPVTTRANQNQRVLWDVPATANFFLARSVRPIEGKIYCEFSGGAEPGAMSRGYGVTELGVGVVFYDPITGGFMFSGNGGCGLPASGFQNAETRTSSAAYSFLTTDVIGIAFNSASRQLWFSKNGVWLSGNPSAGTSPTMTLATGGPFYFSVSAYSCGIAGGEYSYDIYPAAFSQTYPIPEGFEPYQPASLGTSIAFPAGLPLPERDTYSESFEEVRRSTSMEAGTARRRNRMRSAPRLISLTFTFSQEEFTAFDVWWQDTVNGASLPFDIQLLDADDADALVWYTVTVVDGQYDVEVTDVMDYLVRFTVRAVAGSFATRASGNDELGGRVAMGFATARANLVVITPFRATTSFGVYLRATTNLPDLRGAASMGIRPRARFASGAHFGMVATGRFT